MAKNRMGSLDGKTRSANFKGAPKAANTAKAKRAMVKKAVAKTVKKANMGKGGKKLFGGAVVGPVFAAVSAGKALYDTAKPQRAAAKKRGPIGHAKRVAKKK